MGKDTSMILAGRKDENIKPLKDGGASFANCVLQIEYEAQHEQWQNGEHSSA